jgi:hypothetical protein
MCSGRQDDKTIPDPEDLLRRVVDEFYKPDGTGGMRLASSVFSAPELSVDLGSLSTPAETFWRGGLEAIGVIAITAGQARGVGKIIVRDPEPDDPAHALACGELSKRKRRDLRELARWLIHPDATC